MAIPWWISRRTNCGETARREALAEGEELGSNILQVARRTPANVAKTQGMHIHYDRER
jgi:hypothetical protein